MAGVAELKAKLMETIHSLECKRDALNGAIESMKESVRRIEVLSVDECIGLPLFSQAPAPLFEQVGQATASRFSELAKAAAREGTQFHRIADFFSRRNNSPATVAELSEAIGASRSATTNILYRTQREAFVSERVPGHSRLRAWRIHPDLFGLITDDMPAHAH